MRAGGGVEQLTVDHSLYAQMVAEGHDPGPDFAYGHVVTRALGTPSGDPEVVRRDVRAGDVYLVCSDGLSGVLEPAEIGALLVLETAEAACHALVEAALVAGTRDNVSVIVVRVEAT
jgi:serine/threonine protein phosphatase PrpC